MPDLSIPIRRISRKEICRMFNEGQYWERAKRHELKMIVLEDRHPSLTAANEPFCTQSQIVSYRDANDNEVARVHQYLRADRTIGASGRPDPKTLFENGILFRIGPQDENK